ncbi:MAG: site-specific integrase [Planctomycetota bacterium]|nr:site-specific integrase [Planctomycetota bacterium]
MGDKGGRPRSIVRDPDTGDVVNGLSRRKKTGVFYATAAKPYKSFGRELKSAIRKYKSWRQRIPMRPPVMEFEATRRQKEGTTRGLADWLPLESTEEYLAVPPHFQAFIKDSHAFYHQFAAFLSDLGLDAPGGSGHVLLCGCVKCDYEGQFDRQGDFVHSPADREDQRRWIEYIQDGYARYWVEFLEWLIGNWIKANPVDAARRLDYPELTNLEAIKPKPPSMTLSAIADLFEQKPVGDLEYRRRFAKRFREFAKIIGVKTVKQIEVEHIEKYHAHVLNACERGGYGRTYMDSRFDVITGVLSYAHKRGRDQDEIRRVLDRCEMLETPRNGTRPKAEARPVTPDELHAILEHAGTLQKAVILLGINAGFDPVDIQRVPLAAVDLIARILHFNRIKAAVEKPTPRIATLWPRTVRAIRTYTKECSHEARNERGERLLFATETGLPIRVGRTWISRRIWRPLREAAGLPDAVQFKGLRKAAFTEAFEVSERQAHILLGHRFKGVTDNYLRRNPHFVAAACRAIEKAYFG